MTYLDDLAEAKRTRRAWTCTCGADNPNSYDACHDCQAPSWTCAACGTVNPQRCSNCTECGNASAAEAIGDEEGLELTHEEWVAMQVGPRRVGGRYDHGYADSQYEVLDIDRGPRATWPSWQITVRDTDGETRKHCTSWDPRRDRAIAEPPADAQVRPDQSR
ncbi:zinc ribbon domain-containing protein [Streptomyces marianii]|uniref:Zinc ribbon domain-containing protein n=1 Tax=Streptomyces marianii TaxID=1817406 RepID=A0A5R9DR85_9ACTN|nr:zinc ribbon domain-containing protein [Streptomyces marianii]TLQ39006.1 zinc ribbon domain-containing protein [Streptomyces marianii]